MIIKHSGLFILWHLINIPVCMCCRNRCYCCSFFSPSFCFVFGVCWLCNLSVCSLILYISIFSESVTQSHHIIHHPENCTCLLKTHFKAHAHSVPFSYLQTAEGFHSWNRRCHGIASWVSVQEQMLQCSICNLTCVMVIGIITLLWRCTLWQIFRSYDSVQCHKYK